MNLNPDDFRAVYADLSDEALLAVERDDLVDVARQVYDEELASRGLARPAAEAPAVVSHAEPAEEFVPVVEYNDHGEAKFAWEMLRSAGIPARLTARIADALGTAPAGFPVLVPASALDSAREILESSISEEELNAQAEAAVNFDELIAWKDEYATGLPEIDDQHERIFEAAADLQLALYSATGPEFSAMLHAFAASAAEHFAREEELMEAAAYPHLDEHRAEHATFTASLLEKVEGFDAGQVEATVVIAALCSWLPQHITTDDRRMGEHLR